MEFHLSITGFASIRKESRHEEQMTLKLIKTTVKLNNNICRQSVLQLLKEIFLREKNARIDATTLKALSPNTMINDRAPNTI